MIPPVLPACPYCGAPLGASERCSACGGTPDHVPDEYRLPEPPRAKPLIDPLYQREWIRFSAVGVLVLGLLTFFGPTIILPASVGKPMEFDFPVILSVIVSLVQVSVCLGAVTENERVTKRLYAGVLTTCLVASLCLGFGDIGNAVAFGVAGAAMAAVRLLNTFGLGVALFAANAVKQLPVD